MAAQAAAPNIKRRRVWVRSPYFTVITDRMMPPVVRAAEHPLPRCRMSSAWSKMLRPGMSSHVPPECVALLSTQMRVSTHHAGMRYLSLSRVKRYIMAHTR